MHVTLFTNSFIFISCHFCELPLPFNVLLRSSFTFVQKILFLFAVLAFDEMLFVSKQLAEKEVKSMARPAQVVVEVLRFLPNLIDIV